jgi:MHS family proline/betaine transporter-like MFS transporter
MYMMGAAVVGGIAVLLMSETARKPLEGSPPAVSTDAEARRILKRLRRKGEASAASAQETAAADAG